MFGVFNCNSSRSEVPRLLVPEELFTNIAKTVGFQVNRSLSFLQDVASGGNLKQFLLVRNIYIWSNFCCYEWLFLYLYLKLGWTLADGIVWKVYKSSGWERFTTKTYLLCNFKARTFVIISNILSLYRYITTTFPSC